MDALRLQGRVLTAADLAHVRECLSTQPEWGRKRLSIHLAERWDWRNPRGQLKDMAARTLLLKLERRGLIQLPAPRSRTGNANRYGGGSPLVAPAAPLCGLLAEFEPFQVVLVSSTAQRRFLAQALRQFHYLGFRQSVGENVAYLIYTHREQLVALLLFGAPAWKVAARDSFIGWSAEARRQNLQFIANNSRFLILPWVRIGHLASHVLGKASRRVSQDWQTKYGHPLHLLETFVEQERFAGTAYRAANWIKVGATTGRTRQDAQRQIQSPIKDLYLYPLSGDFRQRLAAAP